MSQTGAQITPGRYWGAGWGSVGIAAFGAVAGWITWSALVWFSLGVAGLLIGGYARRARAGKIGILLSLIVIFIGLIVASPRTFFGAPHDIFLPKPIAPAQAGTVAPPSPPPLANE